MPMTKTRFIIIIMAQLIQVLLFVIYKLDLKNINIYDLYANIALPLLAVALNFVSFCCFNIYIGVNGNIDLLDINAINNNNELNGNNVVIDNEIDNEIIDDNNEIIDENQNIAELNEQQEQDNDIDQANDQQEQDNDIEQANVQQEQDNDIDQANVQQEQEDNDTQPNPQQAQENNENSDDIQIFDYYLDNN